MKQILTESALIPLSARFASHLEGRTLVGVAGGDVSRGVSNHLSKFLLDSFKRERGRQFDEQSLATNSSLT
jgi:hypothetical protein